MSGYEPAVFISYAWQGEREEIVNQIDKSLQKRGLKIVRDKRDLGYKGSISEFMERIGRGDCVIVVISDKYLRSPNCMFELVEFADGQQFRDRIFPVILNDANIYDPIKRIEYIQFWEAKHKELAKAMKKVDPANLQGIREEIDLYVRIRGKISGLTSILKDMNVLTPDMHRESDFSAIYDGIEKRMKEVPAEPKTPGVEDEIPLEYFEPETIFISAGMFLMGSPTETDVPSYEIPQHEVQLPAYRIGKYPVTNEQYGFFIRDTRTAVSPLLGWDGQTFPPGMGRHPVTGVTWYEALAYCRWLSEKTRRNYLLPNEAQWEKSCRGGNNTIYPWGNEFDPARCNHGSSAVAAVDAYPPQNEFGCHDLIGNVIQWTITQWGQDRFTPDELFRYPWRADSRNDLSASGEIRRVVRGSSMKDDILAHRCSMRRSEAPEQRGFRGSRMGFRVIMQVE